MTSGVDTILADLWRLNTHARAVGGGARDAIYAYKEAATWALIVEGRAGVRPVRWRGPCGKCDGTGRFTFWDGGDAPCRGCRATGTTALRFAEIALPDGQVWHHPWSKYRGGFIGYSMLEHAFRGERGDLWYEEIDWVEATDWSPRQPGQRLDGDAFVEAVNRVESWVLAAVNDRALDRKVYWRLHDARREMMRYPLIVTHRAPDACFRCGAEAPLESVRIGASGAWPLQWSARICTPCYANWKESDKAGQWPDALPAGCLSEDIDLWVSRRPTERPRCGWEAY